MGSQIAYGLVYEPLDTERHRLVARGNIFRLTLLLTIACRAPKSRAQRLDGISDTCRVLRRHASNSHSHGRVRSQPG